MSESGKNPETRKRRSGLANYKVKIWQLIVPACLTVICLIGIIAVLSQPQQIKSQTSLVNWEHRGKFDYTAYLKPSFLFGSKPVEAPTAAPNPTPSITPTQLSPLKYPAESVVGFHFTLNYSFNSSQAVKSISNTCRITAQGIDASGKNQEIELLASIPAEGSKLAVDFDLPISDQLSKGNININIIVYPVVNLATGPLYESFSLQFPIRRESTMLVIDRAPGGTVNGYLGSLSYSQTGLVSYQVLLKDSQGSKSLTVIPPSTQPPVVPIQTPVVQELTKVGPAGSIFIKLLEGIDASFRYDFSASQPVTNLTRTVRIEAELKAGNIWSKTISLVPAIVAEGSIPFNIDYPALSKMIDTIREETGASIESSSMAIRAIVQISGKTPYGDIMESFSPTLTAKIEGGRLIWVEPLQQTKTGKIEKEIILENNTGIAGLSYSETMSLLLPLIFVFLVVFVFLFIIYRKNTHMAMSPVEKRIRQYKKKYGDRITEVSGGAHISSGSEIEVDSMDNLIRIAGEVGKPIIHRMDTSGVEVVHSYLIYDSTICYVHIIRESDPVK